MSEKTAIFLIGLPGAGKSSWIAKAFDGQTVNVVDPDAIKETHADYDPANPAALHVWSKKVAEARYAQALQSDATIVYDGTGTTVDEAVSRMRRAKAAGFKTRLVYVMVSLETAVARNAARARTVPESIIREKHNTIQTAFEITARYADETELVWNE